MKWKVAEDQSPIIFSRKSEWNGLVLHHWNVRAGELPETSFKKHEITLPFRGTFNTTRQTETGRMQNLLRTPGDLCLVPSGHPIALNWDEEVDCLSMQIDPALIIRAVAGEAKRIELKPSVGNDPLIWQIGLALKAESESEAPMGRLYAESLANTLAVHLYRHYNATETRLPSNGGLAGRKLRLVKEFIHANLADDLTLAEIAEVADLSPYHFARAFKRTIGLTPQQYLMERRIERAKELLATPELPIVEVSARVGFKNQSHFTTFFRRLTMMTPKAWRDGHWA